MCFSALLSLLCAPHLTFHFCYTSSVTHKHICPFICSSGPSFSMNLSYPVSHPHASILPFRLVHSGPGKSSPLLDSDLSFGLRSGTKQGVETHVFRVDSAKELSTWTHLLVEGCHNAAELIKEVTTGTDTGICLTPSFLFCLAAQFLHLHVENFALIWQRAQGIDQK